ncbi:27789_t:CDS:2, partial [Dentiscutata erythropus]
MSLRNSRQKETKNTTKSLAPKKYGRVTRKEKRNARLFNRHVIVKKIKDQIRLLSKGIRGVPREDESIKSRIEWFTKLKEFTKTSSADNLSLFENIYLNFEAKKKESDAVITSLHQETDRLRTELSEAKNNLEQFRKENEGYKQYYEQTQLTIFPEYLSTIEYLRSRVDQLELYLVKNESSNESSKSGDEMG